MKSPPKDERAWVDELSLEEFEEYERRFKWLSEDARPEQLTPEGDWKTWLLLAGRGFGKTRTASEDVAAYGLDNPDSRIAVVAETFADGRDVCVEGESGLLSVLPEKSVAHWNRSLGELVLTNGTRYRTYSGDKPNQLRGPQHHRAYVDELAKYQYPLETWTQLQLGLRLGDDPRCVVATTPRPIALIKELVGRANVVVTTGSTYENAENLAESFLAEVRLRYEGTSLGDQELHGRIVQFDGESIFDPEWFERNRWTDDWDREVVGRWLSLDLAMKDKEENSYNALTVFELTSDYHLDVRHAWRERLSFPKLMPRLAAFAHEWNHDGLLRGFVVEDKAHGITASQTIREGSDEWLASILIPFDPGQRSKEVRWNQAAVWAGKGCVRLPEPSAGTPWLHDYEEELYALPDAAHNDWADSFAQGVIYLENLVASGYRARQGAGEEVR